MKRTLTMQELRFRINRLSNKEQADLLHDLIFQLFGEWTKHDEPVIWPVNFWECPHLVLNAMGRITAKKLRLPTPVDSSIQEMPEDN